MFTIIKHWPHIWNVFTHVASSYANLLEQKKAHLHEKRVQLPQDFFGTPTWPPFHCFGTPIWPPWCHVKTLYMSHFRRLVEIHSDVIKGIFGMMWLLVFSEWNEYIWMHEYIIYTHSFAKTLCLEEYNRRHLPIALCSALLSMIAEMSLVKSKWWKDKGFITWRHPQNQVFPSGDDTFFFQVLIALYLCPNSVICRCFLLKKYIYF